MDPETTLTSCDDAVLTQLQLASPKKDLTPPTPPKTDDTDSLFGSSIFKTPPCSSSQPSINFGAPAVSVEGKEEKEVRKIPHKEPQFCSERPPRVVLCPSMMRWTYLVHTANKLIVSMINTIIF